MIKLIRRNYLHLTLRPGRIRCLWVVLISMTAPFASALGQTITIIPGNPAPVCAGDSRTYSNNMGSVNWSVTGGQIIGASSGPTVTVLWPGGNGTVSASTTVQNCTWVDPAPYQQCGWETITICEPDMIPPCFSYDEWVCHTIDPPPYEQCTPQQYNGSLHETVNPLPQPSLSGSPSVCANTSGHIYTTQGGMSNYSWSVSPGGTVTAGGGSSSNTVTVAWGAPGARSVSVNYTNGNGCRAGNGASIGVTVKDASAPTFTASTPTACSGTGGHLYATQGGMTNYVWNISSGGTVTSGGTSGSNTAIVTWNGAGAQSVTVSYTNTGGCATPQTVASTNVTATPNAYGMSVSGVNCSGQSNASIILAGSESGVVYTLSNGVQKNGTGGSLTWGGLPAGIYSITAQRGSCTRNLGSANVTEYTFNNYAVSGGGSYCTGEAGSGFAITLNGSTPGVHYQMYRSGVPVGSEVSGNGGMLQWPGQILPGTYTVTAINPPLGCTQAMTGNAQIFENVLPVTFTLTANGNCAGDPAVVLTLNNSESSVSYQLLKDNVNTGASLNGTTGASLTWSDLAPGTYSVKATKVATGCTSNATGQVVLGSIPVTYEVSGGGTYCGSESTAASVSLVSSEPGIQYQLKRNGLNVRPFKLGTGGKLTWPATEPAGTYTVTATNPSGGCARNMSGNAVVVVNQLPVAYTVSGGGAICTQGAGLPVFLSDSDQGISYQLRLNGVNSGSAMAGTGSQLVFPGQTQGGDYTIVAINAVTGCEAPMSGSAHIDVVNQQFATISGPDRVGSQPVTLSTGTGAGFAYQWKKDGDVLAGKTGPALQVSEPGSYQVIVTTSLCSQASEMHFVSGGATRYFNGTIASVRWRTDKPDGIAGTEFKGMYTYRYDDKYEVKGAEWSDPNFVLNTHNPAGNVFRVSDLTYDANGNIQSLRRYNDQGVRIHDFDYAYEEHKNKLSGIPGYVNAYTYNAVGQTISVDKDGDGEDQYIEYDVSGKVTAVFSDEAKTSKVVTYLYDDRGFRLAKVNHLDTLTTWYIRDAAGSVVSVYEQKGVASGTNTNEVTKIEAPIYGAGKLGTYYPSQDGLVGYEITDHLGNVRALIKEQVSVYTATMEDNGLASATNPRIEEMMHFQNLAQTERTDVHMNHSEPSPGVVEVPDKSAYLFWQDGVSGNDAADKSVGPGIMLKVNPGDKVQSEAWVRYENKVSYSRNVDLFLLSQFLGENFLGTGGFEGYTSAQVATSFQNALAQAGFMNDGSDEERPFAYLNYILFDRNLVMKDAGWQRVPEEAGFDPGQEAVPEQHQRVSFDEPVDVRQSGYIYIWVSNESENTRVWFDDVRVVHNENLVVQATDYGVWGDVLREQRADDESKYRYGYQGQYSERDEETSWNHFELREFDPVIGRWLQRDPERQFYSPYVGMSNSPINMADINGGFSDYVNAKTGEKRHIDDGIDIVVVVEDKNWNHFLKFFDLTATMSIPSQRFGILSNFGDNYQAGKMIDFYDMHDKNNPDHLEWITYLFKEGNQIFPNPNISDHRSGTSGAVSIVTNFDQRESALIHTHNWPGYVDGPSEDPDLEKHHGRNGVYNVVVDEKYIHFYNAGEYYINRWGRSRYRSSGGNFSIPRSSFGR